jgi:Cu/Zn superoxide dismutase
MYGLEKGKHGFHIYEHGNLTNGSASTGQHFDPYNKNHGDRLDEERHLGDLGACSFINKLCGSLGSSSNSLFINQSEIKHIVDTVALFLNLITITHQTL